MRLILSIGLLFLMAGIFITPENSAARQAEESDGTLLPDIDPQDIEIRSQYQARYPGLRRQPILGFNPRPRIYQVDPDRLPWMESHEQVVASLPVSAVSRPQGPEYRSVPFAEMKNGYGRIGAGSFYSPEADLYANYEMGEGQWVSGRLNHLSGNGHLSDRESSFRFLGLEGSVRSRLTDRSQLGARLALNSDFNRMLLLPDALQQSMGPAGRKSYNGAETGIRYRNYSNSVEYWDGGLDLEVFGLNQEAGDYSGELRDWNLSFDIGRTWAGTRLDETWAAEIDLQTGGYRFGSPGSGVQWMESGEYTWNQVGIRARYQRMFDYKTVLKSSLGFYQVTDAENSYVIYLSPELNLEHYLSDRITLSGSFTGRPEHPNQMRYHNENRFLDIHNTLQHSYYLKGSGSIAVELLPGNTIQAGFSWQNSKNHPWYERRNVGGGAGYYSIVYGNATIWSAWSGFMVQLIPEVLWIDLEGYIQNPVTGSERIPFTESYGFDGSITIRPVQRLLLEGWTEIVGPKTNPQGENVNSFLHLGARLEYRITERIGVYGKMLNLLNQDYEIWDGYRERPFQVYAGITLKL
ncbi:MAG: hypothetical protein WD529_05375 [Balneolaceae bacterium]